MEDDYHFGQGISYRCLSLCVRKTPPNNSPFTFVTDGVESAIWQAKIVAGEKNVVVSTASILQQCLNAGLMDEIQIDLVPVLLGGGVRLFDNLNPNPINLECFRNIEAPGVTHLRFRVIK